MQRMQILVSGLIHVSILVLPHALVTKHEESQKEGSKNGHSADEKTDKAVYYDDLQGITLSSLKINQERLDRSLSSGLYWSSCYLYELHANAGPSRVRPPFPIAASTSMDLLKDGEDLIVTDDFARL